MNEAMKSSCEKLMTAVNALAVQTGESPESIVDWLADNGGLTKLILSYFSGNSTVKDSLTVQAHSYDRAIHHNPDAQAWAKFFMKTRCENPDFIIDESLMIGWFANAMMAMHDHIKQQPAHPTVKESLTVQAQPSCEPIGIRVQSSDGCVDIVFWNDIDGVRNRFSNWAGHTTSNIYTAPPDYEALSAENTQLKEANKSMVQTLNYIERWANHHAVKPTMSAVEALSCIQHYPCILDITRGYADGKVPLTKNPFAENDRLKHQLESTQESLREHMAICHKLKEERDELRKLFICVENRK